MPSILVDITAHAHDSLFPSPEGVDDQIYGELNIFERNFFQSSVYPRLRSIKREYGQDPRIDARFEFNRKHYNFRSLSLESRDQFETIFSAINHTVGDIFVGGNIKVFLDLGCAPGGFSKFVLENNPDSQGFGITLPTIALQKTGVLSSSRYTVDTADITKINFEAYRPPHKRLAKTGYDLIIAGAFPTGTLITAVERATLALSQLHIMLSYLQDGGTCVMVAGTKAFLWNIEMFAVLRRVFQSVIPAKHGKIHADRSSCYFVCQGFGKGSEEVRDMMYRVKRALDVLKTLDQIDEVCRNSWWLSFYAYSFYYLLRLTGCSYSVMILTSSHSTRWRVNLF